MIKKSKSHLFLTLFLVYGILQAQEANAPKKVEKEVNTLEQQDTIQDFKGTQFLQLDSIAFPAELKRVEEELKQNIVDVILSSNTHTPIFAKKREDGYSASYTKFYGLKVFITPLEKSSDFYQLRLFYYNWTTNKYDKEITRKISKFNVLNDMRFAIYELLNGKDFVRNNYDRLQRENFARVQNLRRLIEEKEIRRKKSNKKNDDFEAEEEERRQEILKKKNKLLRKEREKDRSPEFNFTVEEVETNQVEANGDDEDVDGTSPKLKKGSAPSIEAETLEQKNPSTGTKKNPKIKKTGTDEEITPDKKTSTDPQQANDTLSLKDFDIIPEFETPKKSTFDIWGAFFNEYNKSSGLLNVSTNLRYAGFGGRYILEELTNKPKGFKASLKVGLPLFKDDYEFPVYRSIETEIYRRKILKHYLVLAGLDYSPVHNVNLPSPGANLQVYENDFIWGKIGAGYEGVFNKKTYSIRFEFLKSFAVMSNQDVKLSGHKFGVGAQLQVYKMIGLEFNYAKAIIGGDLDIRAETLQVSATWHFEN